MFNYELSLSFIVYFLTIEWVNNVLNLYADDLTKLKNISMFNFLY